MRIGVIRVAPDGARFLGPCRLGMVVGDLVQLQEGEVAVLDRGFVKRAPAGKFAVGDVVHTPSGRTGTVMSLRSAVGGQVAGVSYAGNRVDANIKTRHLRHA